MVSSSSCSASSRMPLKIGHLEMKWRSVLPFQASPRLMPLKRYSSPSVSLSSKRLLPCCSWDPRGSSRRRGSAARTPGGRASSCWARGAHSQAARDLHRLGAARFRGLSGWLGTRLHRLGVAVLIRERNSTLHCLPSQLRGSWQSCRRCLVLRCQLLRSHLLLQSLLTQNLPS